MDHLLVLALQEVIFTEYEVLASAASLLLGYAVYATFQIYLSTRVAEVGQLAVAIEVDRYLF